MATMIKTEKLTFTYPAEEGGRQESSALREVELEIEKGSFVAILGHNGCGKSTLLKMVEGLVAPDSGEIQIGETIRIGYLAQNVPDMDGRQRVIDYIREVAEYVPTKEGRITASQMLERFLFDPAMQYTPVEKLSGGEKRRLYLLKVLMEAPNVLLLDEPVSGLDPKVTAEMYELISGLNKEGITIIMISHDIDVAISEASHILHICDKPFFGTKEEYLKSELGSKFIEQGEK